MKALTVSLLLASAGLLVIYYYLYNKKGQIEQRSKYELVDNWPNLPEHLVLGNPTAIGIDTNRNLVVFHRAAREWPLFGRMPEHPISNNTILIVDHESGKLISAWGSNQFIMPHGLTVDRHNNVWVTDVGLHQVLKFSHDGTLLMKLGKEREAGADRTHFDQPTDVAVSTDGSFYVSDGYGNNRVIKFSASGEYLFEWGTKGQKQGQFDLPHAVALDKTGNVYVADRENKRIQKFSSSGKFISQWGDKSYGAMTSVAFAEKSSRVVAVDDLSFLKIRHRGSDVILFDSTGKCETQFGRSGSYDGPTTWYHDVIFDEDENIYVGDIMGNRIQKFRKVAHPNVIKVR